MKDEIPLDDPMYASKHIDRIGGMGWHFLCFLLLISWLVTFVMMVNNNEFSFWPLIFFIGAWFVADRIGRKMMKNGYLNKAERKKVLDEKNKDRENA